MKRIVRRRIVPILAALGLVGNARAYTNITTPYADSDLLPLHTSVIFPGSTNNGGVTYKTLGGDETTTAMVDGLFTTDKNFPNGMVSTTSANMDSQTPSGVWFWWNAHFDFPTMISHFVLRTADHGYDRSPDQFQLRGSTNGTTWEVIYRYDNNVGADGQTNPWGTITNGVSPPNYTAVRFDGAGADFPAPPAYTQIRLELFSGTWGDGVGITEWQLAGAAVPQKPTVSITFPTNGATVNTNFTITAMAGDTDGTVTNVYFYDGLSLLGSATTSSCQHVWNPAPLGSHALTAVAWDNSGLATTSAVVNITVTAANIPPAVSITYPTNGATVSTNFTVTVTASDVDGTVTNVSFYDGASYLGSAPTSACQYVWHAAPVGPHTLTAAAWDDKGLATTSSVVNITATNVPPTVMITNPVEGASCIPGRPIVIECVAADSDGVTNVDFFANGIFLGASDTEPFAFTWNGAVEGTNVLTAVAWDSTDRAATSAAVHVKGEYGRGTIITDSYGGTDLLDLYTDAGPHADGDSGGISTPGDGTTNDPAGVTYSHWGGNERTMAMLDEQFDNNKFRLDVAGTSTTPDNMDSNTPDGSWLWWDAHFTDPMVITHFVIRNADWGTKTTPDQFQLRGSSDGLAWTVIYRYSKNVVAGDTFPWTTVAYDGRGVVPGNDDIGYMNNTAVRFDGEGVDFVRPAAYKEIRLEAFSVSNGGGALSITEWQLAGKAIPSVSGSVLIVR